MAVWPLAAFLRVAGLPGAQMNITAGSWWDLSIHMTSWKSTGQRRTTSKAYTSKLSSCSSVMAHSSTTQASTRLLTSDRYTLEGLIFLRVWAWYAIHFLFTVRWVMVHTQSSRALAEATIRLDGLGTNDQPRDRLTYDVADLYLDGVLKVECLGLDFVAFDEEVYDRLSRRFDRARDKQEHKSSLELDQMALRRNSKRQKLSWDFNNQIPNEILLLRW